MPPFSAIARRYGFDSGASCRSGGSPGIDESDSWIDTMSKSRFLKTRDTMVAATLTVVAGYPDENTWFGNQGTGICVSSRQCGHVCVVANGHW